MLSFGAGRRIFLAKATTDMRKSFDTLAAMVTEQLGGDPRSGDMFVFIGRRRDRVKVLIWEVSGFWLCAKRLERGTFACGSRVGARDARGAWPLSAAELHNILEGIDVHRATYHAHYKAGDA